MVVPPLEWESTEERLSMRDDELSRLPRLGAGVLGIPRTLAGPLERVFIEFSLVVSIRKALAPSLGGGVEAEDGVPGGARSSAPRLSLRSRLRFLGDMSHGTRHKSCDC